MHETIRIWKQNCYGNNEEEMQASHLEELEKLQGENASQRYSNGDRRTTTRSFIGCSARKGRHIAAGVGTRRGCPVLLPVFYQKYAVVRLNGGADGPTVVDLYSKRTCPCWWLSTLPPLKQHAKVEDTRFWCFKARSPDHRMA